MARKERGMEKELTGSVVVASVSSGRHQGRRMVGGDGCAWQRMGREPEEGEGHGESGESERGMRESAWHS